MPLRKYIPLLLATLLAAGCGSDTPTDGAPGAQTEFVSLNLASFTAADGYAIRGTWFTSSRQTGARPTVILIHTFGQNHTQWLPFVPDLTNEGYHVLAFDIRGHGQSTFKNGQFLTVANFSLDDFNDMPLDVGGAIAWLKARPEVDAQRIGAIGVDIGANIAFVSSGIYPEIKTAVSISPIARQDQEVLLGDGIPDFRPHSILFMAAFGDGYTYTSSETLAGRTAEPKRVSGYQGAANGLNLLNNREARSEAIQWLKDHL